MEVYDIEEEGENTSFTASLNEFEKAKMRFLDESRMKELSPIVENSKYSSSLIPEINSVHFEPERRKPTKSIKNRVVKDIDNLELEIAEVKGCKTDR